MWRQYQLSVLKKPKLEECAVCYREKYRSAHPFPHIVIDNFLDEELASRIAKEFPSIEAIGWKLWGPGKTKKTQDKNIEKVGTSDEANFGPFTRHFMHELHSGTFLKFLESLTGIPDYLPDPSYHGCGLHSTGRGGKLMIHTDSNRHPFGNFNSLHQHLNLIYYVSPDWREEYGGHLELWNRDATRCETRVAPIFNRAVLFETGKYSYHGHPQPLTCPEGRRRNSLAVYYYLLQRPSDERYGGIQQNVKWVPTTPEDKAWQVRQKWFARFKKLVPPIIFDIPKLFRSS